MKKNALHIGTANENSKIFIYSCGIGHNKEIENIDFSSYDAVYASKALLEEYLKDVLENTDNNISLHIIGAKAKEDAKNILELAKADKKVLVLCSGDALYHGFGGTMIECAKRMQLLDFFYDVAVFFPNITAFQALFHKIGLAWSDVNLFSVHNFSTLPLREILSTKMPLIYGGTKFPAHIIAKEIIEYNEEYAQKEAIVAEYLGYSADDKEEKILKATIEEIAQSEFAPTSIFLLPDNTDILEKSYLPLGLEESFFAKDENLITASDARAIMLARLRLPLKGVMWDLGAGSGSVGLEAAALCPNLEVQAVEKNEKRITDIERNKKKLGVKNYSIYQSGILEKLEEKSLKNPDRIFIGGGGKDIIKIANQAKSFLNKDGIMILSAVTLETLTLLYAWKKEQANVSCIKLDIGKESVLARDYSSFKQINTLYIFIYKA